MTRGSVFSPTKHSQGVGRSTPQATVFETDAERALFGASGARLHVDNATDGVARALSTAKLVGMLAGDRDEGHLAHINTPNTARDMLSIVEAYGEEQLQYWGFS